MRCTDAIQMGQYNTRITQAQQGVTELIENHPSQVGKLCMLQSNALVMYETVCFTRSTLKGKMFLLQILV